MRYHLWLQQQQSRMHHKTNINTRISMNTQCHDIYIKQSSSCVISCQLPARHREEHSTPYLFAAYTTHSLLVRALLTIYSTLYVYLILTQPRYECIPYNCMCIYLHGPRTPIGLSSSLLPPILRCVCCPLFISLPFVTSGVIKRRSFFAPVASSQSHIKYMHTI